MNQQPIINYPPEISALIVRHKNVNRAEMAAGIGQGTFGKIRNGRQSYTEHVRAKVFAALENFENPEGKTMTKAKGSTFEIPEKCPPLLADLLKAKGSKSNVKKVLSCGDSVLNRVMTGAEEMPVGWIVKAKGALGQPVIGAPVSAEEADAPEVPAFVPWDGKAKASVVIAGRGGAKGRTIKGVPEPIVKIFEKNEGNATQTAKSLGVSMNTVMGLMEDPKKFNDKWQRRIHDALYSIAPAFLTSMGDNADTYQLELAIVVLKGQNFDRINEIADILNGRLIFRKQTAAGWLLLYRMNAAELPRFKKLAMRDASEIVCP